MCNSSCLYITLSVSQVQLFLEYVRNSSTSKFGGRELSACKLTQCKRMARRDRNLRPTSLLLVFLTQPLVVIVDADFPSANASVRLWLDSVFFSPGEVEIFKDIVTNSSGRMVVSGETHASFLSTKGAYVPQSWDLYWTVRRACHSVLGAIAPPKRVNCVPGVEAVAYKQPLVRTMQEAYGEAAFEYIPRSYMLPSQYWVWRSWTQRSGSPPGLPWVLKANDHRGRGVRVMRQQQAQRQALRGGGDQAQGDTATQKGFVLVQSYVRQQFLYDNRPSYLRLWVVVTSVRPLRAYLFRGGVLVFGDRLKGAADGAAEGGGAARRRRGGGSAAAAAASQGGRRRELLLLSQSAGTVPEPTEVLVGKEAAPGESLARRRDQRRRLRQQQQQQAVTGGQQQQQAQQAQQYEMHAVNYWTIAGEKMHPWTVGQLRRHAETAWPNDPRVFDRAWAHARASVGMVLGSASRRMRSAARGLAALEGCGFEVLGVDFLLNSTFHPTLVELNALPSLARLRTAPGDPAHQPEAAAAAAGGGGAGGGGGAAAAAAVASFDLEKERFLHHALRLIGMPIGPPPVRGDGSAAAAAGGRGGGAPPPPSVGGVLRAMAALLRPPNNETAELQAFLRLHLLNDVAAAEAALPRLGPLLCPVPAAWGPAPGWPVLEATAAAGGRRLAEAEAEAEFLRGGGSGGGVGGGGGGAVEQVAARRPVGQWDLSRGAALRSLPQGEALGRGRGDHRGGSGEGVAAAAAVAAASAAAAAMAAAGDLDGRVAAAAAADRRRRLHGAAGGNGGGVLGGAQGAAAASGAGGGGGTAAPPCKRRCYDWDVLAAIADTEYELQQDLDFDPIFPMASAHDLNGAALEAARKVAAAAVDKSRTGGGGGAGDGAGSGSGFGFGSDGGGLSGSALLDPDPQSGLQRLQTGLGFVRESITAVNMDLVRSMRYMTTTPYILASTKLPYSRIDAALSAYEAVRQRSGHCTTRLAAAAAGGSANDAAECAVQVLQDTLDELCSGRVKAAQD
ncbi:Tubulin polyglutamylase ttll5 [Pleodorina starrii]|uniref:Tubulin--tyrosine ligase-like protein 5 n=1 Tax=Pleodorina starrii TaxID=330485 RepID=A0A9W6BHT7_9CHLO|nr:Tubulin polyglutamylase ttll5 [Pleodorina starrii]